MPDTVSLPLRPRVDINPKPLGVSVLLILAGAVYLAQAVSPKLAALFVVGTLLGLALYHAAFGFTSSWRVFIADGRGAGQDEQHGNAQRLRVDVDAWAEW